MHVLWWGDGGEGRGLRREVNKQNGLSLKKKKMILGNKEEETEDVIVTKMGFNEKKGVFNYLKEGQQGT